MIKNFNDLLAIILVALIVALWIVQGLKWIDLNEAVSGSLISIFTLIVQYYFRRAPPTNGAPK
jgi:hypothetical protein